MLTRHPPHGIRRRPYEWHACLMHHSLQYHYMKLVPQSDGIDTEAGIRLLVSNNFFVALAALELDNALHRAHRVLRDNATHAHNLWCQCSTNVCEAAGYELRSPGTRNRQHRSIRISWCGCFLDRAHLLCTITTHQRERETRTVRVAPALSRVLRAESIVTTANFVNAIELNDITGFNIAHARHCYHVRGVQNECAADD